MALENLLLRRGVTQGNIHTNMLYVVLVPINRQLDKVLFSFDTNSRRYGAGRICDDNYHQLSDSELNKFLLECNSYDRNTVIGFMALS